ncbi:hypothetical protein JAAARDRAFT_192473 [Jaapia argillacea MUCL 33604]|uniref:Uncharacterized protein n=1 Tax=Jaapia argillacea MUCL 33604 TaxID=933084 RepID=A0A067PYF1_9AGAM|nr:hypothetical protein JAAARDRAFT_192473 [Jaapia argillacea MUCL 33604]
MLCVICNECIPRILEIPEEVFGTLTFQCIACHRNSKEYRGVPYMGFYIAPDKAYFSVPLQVRARKVVTLGSHICNEPLAVIIFALSNLPIHGSPYNAALLQLQNSYADNDTLVTHEIIFDLSVDGALAAHTHKVDQVVVELKWAGIKGAIVMIMTHANDANGLPFFEPAGCCTFKEFFAGVIQDCFIALTKTWDTTWFMLTCGPMMTAGTSLVELVKEANFLEIQRIIGVGIAGFFPCMLNPFMMTFVEKFLIEGETFDKVMPKIVTGLTATLAHIPIYVISPPPPKKATDNSQAEESLLLSSDSVQPPARLTAARYYWFYPKLNPHRQPMPLQFYVDWDLVRYAKCISGTSINDFFPPAELGEIKDPSTIIGRNGEILAWILPEVLSVWHVEQFNDAAKGLKSALHNA